MSTKRPSELQIQDRDVALLKELIDTRILTIKQASLLHFDGHFEAAKKRLQKLRLAKFLVQRARRPQEPAIYHLGRKGYLHLKAKELLDPLEDQGWSRLYKRQQVSELFLRHELAVVDVKGAFVTAIRKQTNLTLTEISVCPERYVFPVVKALLESNEAIQFRSMSVKPDGFLQVRESREAETFTHHSFYLELDRSTESLRRLAEKARHYSQHYRRGGFAAKIGAKREDYKLHPFRVLMVFLTPERRNNVAAKLLHARTPVKTMIWLTTLADLIENPLGSIWLRPLDYERAVRGSEFDLHDKVKPKGYRRRADREVWIEDHALKQTLF